MRFELEGTCVAWYGSCDERTGAAICAKGAIPCVFRCKQSAAWNVTRSYILQKMARRLQSSRLLSTRSAVWKTSPFGSLVMPGAVKQKPLSGLLRKVHCCSCKAILPHIHTRQKMASKK